jgi:hypothetical protein
MQIKQANFRKNSVKIIRCILINANLVLFNREKRLVEKPGWNHRLIYFRFVDKRFEISNLRKEITEVLKLSEILNDSVWGG